MHVKKMQRMYLVVYCFEQGTDSNKYNNVTNANDKNKTEAPLNATYWKFIVYVDCFTQTRAFILNKTILGK